MSDEHKNSTDLDGAPDAQLSASSVSSSNDDIDTETVTPPKRIFTAEERAGQQKAQAEEDAIIAQEEAALKEEQKTLTAQIKARRVGFTASVAHTESGSNIADSDYTVHDNRLVRVLFVESTCDALAPLACAYARSLVSRVLSASAAGVSVGEAILPAAAASLPQDTPLPNQRHSLLALTERSDAKFQFLISLDAAAQTAVNSLPPQQLASLGKPKLIHQPFDRPTDAASAEQVSDAIKTFVQELPDLLSFYA